MKRIRSLALSFGLLASMFCFPVYAGATAGQPIQNTTTEQSGQVSLLRWTSMSQIYYGLTISNGTAEISTSCYSWYSTDKIYVTTTLQKIAGVQVSDIQSWSASGTGSAYNTGSCTVSSGTYRTKVVASVYDSSGKFIETIIVYSTSKTC